jgi:hypothetical protein
VGSGGATARARTGVDVDGICGAAVRDRYRGRGVRWVGEISREREEIRHIWWVPLLLLCLDGRVACSGGGGRVKRYPLGETKHFLYVNSLKQLSE